jgi:hypothetical protein
MGMLALRLTHGIRFAPSGLGLHKPPVGRALSAGTPFVAVCSATFCVMCHFEKLSKIILNMKVLYILRRSDYIYFCPYLRKIINKI